MSAIAGDLARGLEVETEVRIAATRRVDDGWVLIADDGFEIAGFDGLISAVPAPQAVALLADSAELARKAQAVAFRACHALMLEFDAPLECGFDAAFVRDSPLGWLARQASKPGREPSNNWLLHSTSEWSEAHLDLPADRVLELLHVALSEAIGGGVPTVRTGTVHRWLFARPAHPLAGEILWDERLGLGVCGDLLQGDRIEDAYLSADRLVRAMLGSDSRAE